METPRGYLSDTARTERTSTDLQNGTSLYVLSIHSRDGDDVGIGFSLMCDEGSGEEKRSEEKRQKERMEEKR
jgi:hypothetical protein